MEKVIDQAYHQAVEVLRTCAKPTGFYASGLPGGYEATWARDSMITSLGAGLVKDQFRNTIKKSLELLAKNQSYLGQIPNCVGSYNTDRRSDVTFNTIDSNLWWSIGLLAYVSRFNDRLFYYKLKKHLGLSLIWLSYQDPDEVRLLAQQPTMDWQDAFPHKYGYCINTQALYYGLLKLVGKDRQAKHLQRVVNGQTEKYLSLYEPRLGYYYPWAWKNHDGDREHEEWFDTLGNLLAVVTGLATPNISKKILAHVDKLGINYPFPCKCLSPAMKQEDKSWHSYFAKCEARAPWHYLNGGIWPFIGGIYVAALIKNKQLTKAKIELKKLAQGNLQNLNGHSFNEWLDGQNGQPLGEPHQAWSAGAYIYAYYCLQAGKTIYFDW